MQIKKHGQDITIGQNKRAITFVSCRPELKLEHHLGELREVYGLIDELNTLILSMPVREITIGTERDSGYRPEDNGHSLTIGLKSDYENLRRTTVHEMGHAIFRVKMDGRERYTIEQASDRLAVNDSLWQKIYYLSLAKEGFLLVMDGNYLGEPVRIKCETNQDSSVKSVQWLNWPKGHPGDNADELFASSLMVYRLYADEFLKTILNPKTSAQKKWLGRAIWVYMRDKIFAGKYFTENDPFRDVSIKDINIADMDVYLNLRLLIRDFKYTCDNAGYYHSSSGPVSRYFHSAFAENGEKASDQLIRLINDNDPAVRVGMLRHIGVLAHNIKQFPKEKIRPIINNLAMNDPKQKIRDAAQKVMQEKGWLVE
jgi:hypothetical protein